MDYTEHNCICVVCQKLLSNQLNNLKIGNKVCPWSILVVAEQSNGDLVALVQLTALKCIFQPFSEKFTNGIIAAIVIYTEPNRNKLKCLY